MFNKKILSENWCSTIELTNLHSPKSKDIRDLVKEAEDKKYYGVCLLHGDLQVANKYRQKDLKLITVAGFPSIIMYNSITSNPNKYMLLLGYYTKNELSKIRDIIDSNLADELDVIFPFYWYYKGYTKRIKWLLTGIKKRFKKPIKVIIELGTMIRQEEDIKKVCKFLKKCPIDFIKSNSGLIRQPSAISLPVALKILKKHTRYPIKASGGLSRLSDIKAIIDEFGVKRIGTSRIDLKS